MCPTLANEATARTAPGLPALPLVACPAWAPKERIKELFGLSPCHIEHLVKHGRIRKQKLGTDHRATALYSCFDALEWLESGEAYPTDQTERTNKK